MCRAKPAAAAAPAVLLVHDCLNYEGLTRGAGADLASQPRLKGLAEGPAEISARINLIEFFRAKTLLRLHYWCAPFKTHFRIRR